MLEEKTDVEVKTDVEEKTYVEKSKFDHPLFMDKLPDDLEDDETLLAIQNLVYEGTPREVAENFKDSGNDCFKKKEKSFIEVLLNIIHRL